MFPDLANFNVGVFSYSVLGKYVQLCMVVSIGLHPSTPVGDHDLIQLKIIFSWPSLIWPTSNFVRV